MTAADQDSFEGRLIHKSTNGDAWMLVREGGDAVVEHRPNRSSGGRSSRVSVAAFLAGRDSPERAALAALIAGLAEDDPAIVTDRAAAAPAASHPAGPHATEALTDKDRTPGAGALPEPAGGEADAGTG